jgi:hypothetical protein
MSGIWFGLATVAIGLVIRWYIIAETNLARPTEGSGNVRQKSKGWGLKSDNG